MSSFDSKINFDEYAANSNKYFEDLNGAAKANNRKGQMGAMSSDGNFLMIREKKGGFFGIGAKITRTLIDISSLNATGKKDIKDRLSQKGTKENFEKLKFDFQKNKISTAEYGSFSFSKTKQGAKKNFKKQ
jgi:hypothetical protein